MMEVWNATLNSIQVGLLIAILIILIKIAGAR